MALCGLVNITPSVMFHSMFRKRRKFKVFDSIVKFIAINMMNNFFWMKWSTKIFFHNYSMFMNTFTIMTNSFISTCINPYIVIRRFFVQSPGFVEPIIMFMAKTLGITRVITTIYAANIRTLIIRLYSMKPSIIMQSCIVFLTKTFCIMDFIATICRTNFCDFFRSFHNKNIIKEH